MKKKVYAYLHTHWDREWYRDKEDFNIRLVEVIDIVLDELNKGNCPYFYLDGQIIALLDYLKYRKNKKEEIINLIKEKKLGIGPFFASIDSYLVNFNSMLKNLEIGLRYSKEFNQTEFIGYMADIFGISKSIFEALKLNNIEKAMIWRGVNPKDINNNCNFLYDNIKTTWLVQGYFNDFFHSENDNKILNIKNYLDKISAYSKDKLLLPIGGDHLGILKNANTKIEKINSQLEDYEIILTSPFEYFKKTKAEFNFNTKAKEFLDNSKTYILKGCYTTRIPQKIKNSVVQNKLSRIIEPLNFFLKDKYDENINSAWQTLIKNHTHDDICGCSLDSVKKSVDYRYLKVENILNALEKRLIGNFKKKYNLKGKSTDKIGVFNLANTNLDTVKVKLPYILENSQVLDKETAFLDELLYDIYKIPVTEDITTIYTQLIEIKNSEKFSFNSAKIIKPIKETKASQQSIENKYIKLEIKNKKVNIINKSTNETITLKAVDIKDEGDSYNSAPLGEYKELLLKKTKVISDGDIQSTLRLYFNSFYIDVCLNNKEEYLNFNVTINNKKKNHKLQMVLELKNKINKTISDDAIGIIERNIDSSYDIRNFMPTTRPYELKTNSFPMQNFINTQNVNVLTKGLNEYEIFENKLKITLLRSIGIISNPKNKARAIPAGPPLLTPQMQCLGEIKLNFAILFGNYKKAFDNLDKFKENYCTFGADFKKDINITFLSPSKNSFIYGIFKNKKISYNISDKKVELI